MEQHPVPQNVTTFQFRLIGDMTIKQFGYLAVGAIGGYISYKLPLPFFFDWPLAILSVCLGIGLAFVPIEERPMDVWLLSFIKSVYSPTQYLWQRQKKEAAAVTAVPSIPTPTPTAPPPFAPVIPKAAQSPPAGPGIAQMLEHLFVPQMPKPASPPATHVPQPKPAIAPAYVLTQQAAGAPWNLFGFLKDLFAPRPRYAPAQTIPKPAPGTPAPTQYPNIFATTGPMPSLTGKKVELPEVPVQPVGGLTPEQKAEIAAEQIAAKAREDQLTQQMAKMQEELRQRTTTDERILELQKQLTDVLSERSKMEQELTVLRTKVSQAAAAPQVVRQAGVVQAPITAQPTVRVITPETAVKAGLPRLTTFPNVVTGIIKDADGNLLPGVLVTVRDKDEVPVRALKTNKLGQFAASTPLPNGTFTVDIEDPRTQHFFDRIRITLTGSVMPPVEVVSKSKKEMDRSKLAQQIFGGGPT